LATSGYVGLQAESDGLGTLSMTLSTFSGLELSEAEGAAFGSKKELIFLCIVVQLLSFITQCKQKSFVV
jgi:hypothetical protein